ncbi:60S ribosomal protein L36-like [Peromyscus californicus insignis]|uniref:60S ribosomal protein L36-like n=1 Tax=Peromyscus californicus insignis TaxID=564181 RepID=UPI0022A74757|nr:60S ribosomal protein L36-like [Peromyscus californicus insignis]
MALGDSMAVDLNKSKVTKNISEPGHSQHRSLTHDTKFMWDMIQEVCGFMPYEQHAIGLVKVSKDKHTPKFIKKRVGMHAHAHQKEEKLSNVLVAMRKARTKKG